MKAVHCNAFGRAADVLEMRDDVPKPTVTPGSGKMLIRVLACGLTPGDCRGMSGTPCF